MDLLELCGIYLGSGGGGGTPSTPDAATAFAPLRGIDESRPGLQSLIGRQHPLRGLAGAEPEIYGEV